MKWIGMQLGLEKIMMKQQKMIGYFISDQNSQFFDSPYFSKILRFVQKHPEHCTLKEKQTRGGLRLLLTFNRVNTVQEGLQFFQQIVA